MSGSILDYDRRERPNPDVRAGVVYKFFDTYVLEAQQYPVYKLGERYYSRVGDEAGRKSFILHMIGCEYNPSMEFCRYETLRRLLPSDLRLCHRIIQELDKAVVRSFMLYGSSDAPKSIQLYALSALRVPSYPRDELSDISFIELLPSNINRLEWVRQLVIRESDRYAPGLDIFNDSVSMKYPIVPAIDEECAAALRKLYMTIIEKFEVTSAGPRRNICLNGRNFIFEDVDSYGAKGVLAELGTNPDLYKDHRMRPVEWYYAHDEGLQQYPLWMLVKLQQWICVDALTYSTYSGYGAVDVNGSDIVTALGMFLLSHGIIDIAVKVNGYNSKSGWVL